MPFSVLTNGTTIFERDPAYTAYDKRALYKTYDVATLLEPGPNALGAILGGGWFDAEDLATWNFDRASWRGERRLRLILDLFYEDGGAQSIISDETWRTSTGPILHDGIYTGEIYDARLEAPGWSRNGFDDSGWKNADILSAPSKILKPQICPSIAIAKTIAPIGIREPEAGTFIVDFGQNFSGHVRLRLTEPAGTKVVVRYGEKLGEDGLLDTRAIDGLMTETYPRQSFQSDAYICKGEPDEIWEQRFSYSGFRYLEATGLTSKPQISDFEGRFAHTNFETAGEFACSDPIANKIQEAAGRSYLSNAQSIPTDCPTREKNGWTGDAQLASETGLMNYRSELFYEKWLNDLSDIQLSDGRLGVIAPSGGWGIGEVHLAWDSAYPIIAWNLYLYRGDTRILARHYDRLRRYVDYLAGRTENGVIAFDSLGDWCPWKTTTSDHLTSSIYFYNDLRILADSARVLGKSGDAARYGELASQTKSAINAKWFDEAKGIYDAGSQTAQSMALFYGVVPDGHRDAVFAVLESDVEKQGHIDAGILGAKYVLRTLAQMGRADLALKIVVRTERPGWGAWIREGMTTLCESWNLDASLNHIMFGDVSNWLIQWIAGIGLDPQSPGFAHFLLRPQAVGDLTWAKGAHESPFGRIAVEWRKENGRFHLNATVPPNCSATLWMPSSRPERVTEGGRSATDAEGIRFLRQDNSCAVFALDSGTYALSSA